MLREPSFPELEMGLGRNVRRYKKYSLRYIYFMMLKFFRAMILQQMS